MWLIVHVIVIVIVIAIAIAIAIAIVIVVIAIVFVFYLTLMIIIFSMNAWLSITAEQYNNDTLLCGHFDRFQLVISSDKAEAGFYIREHSEGDSFSASYQTLQSDVQGI